MKQQTTARARLDPDPDHRAEILIVDDELFIRKRLHEALMSEGFRVRLADSGERALEEIEARAPDLVVLDKNMGEGLNGTEVCKSIKSSPRTSSIPVIMLTSVDGVDEKVEALSSGADDYVIKSQHVVPELLLRVENKLRFRDLHRDASPLTQLPGNVKSEHELRRRVEAGAAFAYLYADIDGFKEYNDLYGHQRGDEMILAMAQLLKSCIDKHGAASDFIGHIGGDDFVVICAPERAQAIGDALARGFDAMVMAYFDLSDRERGYLEVQGRTGKVERYRLTSLTVAVVSGEGRIFQHPGEVGALAAEVKRNAKARARRGEREVGSHVAWERRSRPGG